MSKQHKIRWSEQDTNELNRAIRNFNAKVTRLSKNNPEISNILPEKVSAKEIRKLIDTRQDLKREINMLKRFSKRGSEAIVTIDDTEHNIRMTKWMKTEMNRRIGIINRKRQKRLEDIEKLEMTSRGKKLGYTRGQLGMGSTIRASLEPMKAFYYTMENFDVKRRWKSILKQSKDDYFTQQDFSMRENFIKAIQENFHYENVSDIVNAIQNMDIKEFFNVFQREGGTFEWSYPDPEQEKQYANYLRSQYNIASTMNSKDIISEELLK